MTRKTLISILILTLCALILKVPAAQIRIPDIWLYKAISAEVRGVRVYERQMRKLTTLNAKVLGISDLTGLEHATNLTTLDLSGNRITDVSLLTGLIHLTDLNLSGNGIVEITPLSALKKLTHLNLKGNAIVDISPLMDLPALAVLNLEGNEIRETSDLAVLKNRTALNFKNLGGTVRGEIVEPFHEFPIEAVKVVLQTQDGTEYTTTTTSLGEYTFTGIPAGRYLLSIYKKGYHDRIGKPVTIVKGGDHSLPLKMVEMDSLLSSFRRLLLYILLLCGITALITFTLTKRWITARSEEDT